MTKVVITIEDTPDGGLMVIVEPGAPQLMERALAGVATTAESHALAAYARVVETMDNETEPSSFMELGELPEAKH